MTTLSPCCFIAVAAITLPFLNAQEAELPLTNVEKALIHFGKVTLPKLDAKPEIKDKKLTPLSRIRDSAMSVRCNLIFPDFKDDGTVVGIRWPTPTHIVVTGSVEQVKKSKANFWSIAYSGAVTSSMHAYVDAETGEPLLVFIMPEG